jgi:hypothetical protein
VLDFDITGGDGSYTFLLAGQDAVGNGGSSLSIGPMVLDTTAPAAPTIALASATPTIDPLVLATVVDCADLADVAFVLDKMVVPVAFMPCSQAAGALQLMLPADAAYTGLVAFGRDAAGNVSAASNALSVLLDTTPPVASFTYVPSAVAAGSLTISANIAWTVSDANFTDVVVEWSDGGAFTAVATSTSPTASTLWFAPAHAAGTGTLRLRAHDIVGHETIVTSPTFVFDTTAPVPNTLSFTVQGDPTVDPAVVSTPFAAVSFHATDTDEVADFCLKIGYGSGPAPLLTANDPCFLPLATKPNPDVQPASDVTVTDQPYRLGFIPGPQRIFLWVRDRSQRVSLPVFVSTIYDPGDPPVITNFYATTSDTPSTPLAPTDLTVRNDEALYIKWNVAFPPSLSGPTTPSGPAVLIDYLTPSGFQPIPGTEGGLTNGDNDGAGGCTVDAGKTGCYLWPAGAPKPSTYFTVRLRATNNKAIQSVRTTVPPLNTFDPGPSGITGDDVLTRRFDFLAGNPDIGLGGNLRATVFNNRVYSSGASFDSGSFAVSSQGVIYFRDQDNGLLWVNPVNGNVELLIRIDATRTGQGDGAPLSSATTLQAPGFIAIDFEDRLLIWDYERIRRITVTADGLPSGIEAVAGGGALLEGTNVAPSDVYLINCTGCNILPLPSGDLYFGNNLYLRSGYSGAPARIWHYQEGGGTPRADSLAPHGFGYWDVDYASTPLSPDCTADPNPCGYYFTSKAFCDPGSHQCVGCTAPGTTCPMDTRCDSLASSVTFDQCVYDIAQCTLIEPVIEFDALGSLLRMHAWSQGSYQGSPCPAGRVTLDTIAVSVTDAVPAAVHQPQVPGAVPYPGASFFKTGMDGKVYAFISQAVAGLYQYDHSGATDALKWKLVLGLGVGEGNANCPDDTEATSCVTELQDFFVDALGNIYFLAYGQLRTIVTFFDVPSGTYKRYVRTIGGQGLFFGDGGDPLSARFTMLSTVRRWNDAGTDKLVVSDVVNERLREVSLGAGATVETLAGNGFADSFVVGPSGLPPSQQPVSLSTGLRFGVEPNGRVHLPNSPYAYLDRGASSSLSDDRWHLLGTPLSGTSKYYYEAGADGTTDAQPASANFFALTPTHVLYTNYRIPSIWSDGMVKAYALADGTQRQFAGVAGPMVPGFCDDPTDAITPDNFTRDNCGIDMTYGWITVDPTFDDFGTVGCADDRYVLPANWPVLSRLVRTLPADCGPVSQGNLLPGVLVHNDGSPVVIPHAFVSMVYVRRDDLGPGTETIYYCNYEGNEYRLHRYQVAVVGPVGTTGATGITGPTGPRDETLPWPVATMQCGPTLLWDASKKSLTFTYGQGGLYGVAEYLDVP